MSINHRNAVVVTGASSGIGRACALKLDQAGYQVFATVRKEKDAESLRQVTSEYHTPVFWMSRMKLRLPRPPVSLLRQSTGPG